MDYTHLRYCSEEIANVLTAVFIMGWRVVQSSHVRLQGSQVELSYDSPSFYYTDATGSVQESSISWNPCGSSAVNKNQASQVINLVRKRDFAYYKEVLMACYRVPASASALPLLSRRLLVTGGIIAWRQLDAKDGISRGSNVYHGV